MCKSACRSANLQVTETVADVPLQSLLQYTVIFNLYGIYIVFTDGFDGSSGQDRYKRKFHSTEDLQNAN